MYNVYECMYTYNKHLSGYSGGPGIKVAVNQPEGRHDSAVGHVPASGVMNDSCCVPHVCKHEPQKTAVQEGYDLIQ